MQRLSIIVLVTLAFAAPASAFEVDAFKSGMSKEQVKDALKSYTFDKVQDFSVQTLIAYDQPEKGSNRQFVFDFCNDKLAGMQQEMAPSNRNFVIIISNYNAKYGQPIRVNAGSNVTRGVLAQRPRRSGREIYCDCAARTTFGAIRYPQQLLADTALA
jgi:hypothetical protein